MGDWREWSDWLRPGYYLSYARGGVRYYEHVLVRDFAHWVYSIPTEDLPIASGASFGPTTPDTLEITRGYDKATKQNNIWQLIFGIKGQVYVYIELPTDTHRHGLPKAVKPSAELREVSHFEEWMSPFQQPGFITEHFLMRPGLDRMSIEVYNPQEIDMPDVKLRFFIAKMVTERIGSEGRDVEGNLRLMATATKWKETLDKLYRRVIPHRPITLMPIRLPAKAPSGE